MERTELIRRMVLNEICEDYENVDQIIFPNVAKDGVKLGLQIERSEIVDALAGLVADGLAKAYMLSSKPGFSRELEGMPRISEIETYFATYFYITAKGMEVHLSDDSWWPLADAHEAPE